MATVQPTPKANTAIHTETASDAISAHAASTLQPSNEGVVFCREGHLYIRGADRMYKLVGDTRDVQCMRIALSIIICAIACAILGAVLCNLHDNHAVLNCKWSQCNITIANPQDDYVILHVHLQHEQRQNAASMHIPAGKAQWICANTEGTCYAVRTRGKLGDLQLESTNPRGPKTIIAMFTTIIIAVGGFVYYATPLVYYGSILADAVPRK